VVIDLLLDAGVQDEPKIADLLGIWTHTFTIIVLTLLLITTLRTSYILKLKISSNLICFGASLFSMIVVVLTDMIAFS
jgi:hypothetical protein